MIQDMIKMDERLEIIMKDKPLKLTSIKRLFVIINISQTNTEKYLQLIERMIPQEVEITVTEVDLAIGVFQVQGIRTLLHRHHHHQDQGVHHRHLHHHRPLRHLIPKPCEKHNG